MKNQIKTLEKCDPLINASGNEMDILGVVDIPVAINNGETIQQEFKRY